MVETQIFPRARAVAAWPDTFLSQFGACRAVLGPGRSDLLLPYPPASKVLWSLLPSSPLWPLAFSCSRSSWRLL